MPVLPEPEYLPPFPFQNGNIATLYPPLFRPTPPLPVPGRERIDTPDGDYLIIDRHQSDHANTRKLAVISHGLEGHSRKKYVLGMARMVTSLGYDAACWDQRGCSREANLLPRSYHSGETNDIHTVITHCLDSDKYDDVALIGFSMSGNQILKYLGENPDRVPPQVAAAAVFSVPVDLAASERVLARPSRRIYFEYFMKGLRKKIRGKARRFPDLIDPTHLKGIQTLRQFDDIYTAPCNGFTDAADYYARSGSKQFLAHIAVKTLLVNAQNDPFLPKECYPVHEAAKSDHLHLEMPKYGGHVGFVQKNSANVYWSEERVRDFLTQ